MALIKCPNCNKTISDINTSCPFCSTPLKGKGSLPLPKEAEAWSETAEEDAVDESISDTEKLTETEEIPEAANKAEDAKKKKEDSATDKKTKPSPPSGSEHSDFYKKHSKLRPGRRLLGFRIGNPLFMFLSIIYYMTAATGILKFASGFPVAAENGKLVFMFIRLICLLLICYLPVFLFTGKSPDHPNKKELRLLGITDAILLVLFVLCSLL